MADNYTAGAYTFASDDVGGTHTPRVKPAWGADGAVADVSVAAPMPVQLVPLAGATGADAIGFASVDTTKHAVKASAGAVYGFYLYNRSTAKRHVRFYDASVAGTTVGTTTPKMGPFVLEADQGMVFTFPHPVSFATAITIAATTGYLNSDTGSVTSGDVQATVIFK